MEADQPQQPQRKTNKRSEGLRPIGPIAERIAAKLQRSKEIADSPDAAGLSGATIVNVPCGGPANDFGKSK